MLSPFQEVGQVRAGAMESCAALVIGGADGFGRYLTAALANRGADVVVADGESAARPALKSATMPGRLISVPWVCGDSASLDGVFAYARSWAGSIDALAHVVDARRPSVLPPAGAYGAPIDWVQTHLRVAMQARRSITPEFAEKQSGRVLNVVVLDDNEVGQSDMLATAMIAHTVALAEELEPFGCAANLLVVGGFEGSEPATKGSFAGPQVPEDMMVALLLTGDSSLTGQSFYINKTAASPLSHREDS